ncbi:MAG: hypothetical protein H6Q40_662, partial [Deltaproteobacteria bacterium]|nr:hypothetical protein [Deltaproteobacteria bacterium]
METRRWIGLGLLVIFAVAFVGCACLPKKDIVAPKAAADIVAPKAAAPAPAPVKQQCGNIIPPTAKAGECYAQILIPERYQTTTERVLTRQASEKVEVIPAKYETVEQKVAVREASKRFEETPAEYG